MKATPQKPGPNGSRVVKRRSIPRLGDGLSEILNGVFISCATDKESDTTTTTIATTTKSHDRSSPTSTSSGSTSDTNITTPGSCARFSSITQRHGAKEHLNFQHYGLPLSVSTQTYSQLFPTASLNNGIDYCHGDQPSSISPGTSSSPSPIHVTPAHMAAARILQGIRSSNDSALHKLILWFLGGNLSLSETMEMAKQYQYWDFLQALEASHVITTPDVSQTGVSQEQGLSIPVATSQSAEHSTSYTFNNVHSGPQSAHQYVTGATRQHFYWKLMKHVDIDKVIDPNRESKLHLFVDMSNIFIGFCDAIKASRQIPQSHRIPVPSFSFRTFALLMERERVVQKRILAGSTPGYSASNPRMHWPPYFAEAEELYYEMNIFCRVQTRKPSHSKRRGRRSPKTTPSDVHDLSTGESVGDDGVAVTYEVRNGEQGVDENLHLNMMNSMWDHISCPGTIVLATGDAAEAEFSNGFLHYATRALEKGWKLELVTWKHSISSAWTNTEFLGKYSGHFRIVFLDDFIEELQTGEFVF
ncbi:hypothetical protein F4781DRAFT_388259 [Annulohypoxylon bovei var. microspora]|nr:hypothetical protein F4781DRAFT_388259 [Annulohypoxylon bovei var. microspora]